MATVNWKESWNLKDKFVQVITRIIDFCVVSAVVIYVWGTILGLIIIAVMVELVCRGQPAKNRRRIEDGVIRWLTT